MLSRIKNTNSASSGLRYKLGQKFCSHCALFVYPKNFVCPDYHLTREIGKMVLFANNLRKEWAYFHVKKKSS